VSTKYKVPVAVIHLHSSSFIVNSIKSIAPLRFLGTGSRFQGWGGNTKNLGTRFFGPPQEFASRIHLCHLCKQ